MPINTPTTALAQLNALAADLRNHEEWESGAVDVRGVDGWYDITPAITEAVAGLDTTAAVQRGTKSLADSNLKADLRADPKIRAAVTAAIHAALGVTED